MRHLLRSVSLAGAACAWIGLGIQFHLLINSETLSPIEGAWRFFAFFTILTNIICAALFTQTALTPAIGEAGARLRAGATVYIVAVGVIYVTVLQARWDPQGLQLVGDRMLHYATPILFALYWLVCVPKAPLRWRDAVIWLAYPAFYLVYSVGRAQFDGFYPYFFLDPAQIGWAQFAINGAGLFVGFLALSLALIALARVVRRP